MRHLCPWDGPKGIGGPQDWLVVHDRLWGYHGNATHLMTHLRRELVKGQESVGETREKLGDVDRERERGGNVRFRVD